MTTDEIKQHAKLLRKGLEQDLENRVQQKTLQNGRTQLDPDLIYKYIPLGTTFADVEKILSEAGLHPRYGNADVEGRVLVGGGNISERPFMSIGVTMTFFPARPDDLESGVGRAGASLNVISL